MVGVNVFAADSDAEAQRMFTSLQQQFINLRRGTPGPLPPPVDDMDALWSPAEKAMVSQSLSCSAVGSPAVIEERLKTVIAETGADELITTDGQIYDHAARLRSFEIAAEVRDRAHPALVIISANSRPDAAEDQHAARERVIRWAARRG